MDFITRLSLSNSATVNLVVVDRLKKYAHFGTLPTSYNATQVAKLFMEIMVKHHGYPHTVMSDQDAIFCHQALEHLFHLSGTTLNYSTAYHLQTFVILTMCCAMVNLFIKCWYNRQVGHQLKRLGSIWKNFKGLILRATLRTSCFLKEKGMIWVETLN